MKIYVDADACPTVIKDILYRAAERKKLQLILIANQPLRVPPSKFIQTLTVSSGFDVADDVVVVISAETHIAVAINLHRHVDTHTLVVAKRLLMICIITLDFAA